MEQVIKLIYKINKFYIYKQKSVRRYNERENRIKGSQREN